MTVLGIETSTRRCSVGFMADNGRSDEQFLSEPRVHSEKILTLIDAMLNKAGLERTSLGAVAVSIGPGSFTGLRIGLSTAKGLAYARSCPIVSVPTFDGCAQALWDEGLRSKRVLVAVDARQGEHYTALYEFGSKTWQVVRPAGVSPSGRIAEQIKEDNAGMVLTDSPDIFRANGSAGFEVRTIFSYCRGSIIARLGKERLARGAGAAIEELEPFYLKEFIAKKGTKG